MLIIGAKGFAKEVLSVCNDLNISDNLFFYDDISTDLPDIIYGNYSILRSEKEVIEYFQKIQTPYFTLGLGNPLIRKSFYEKMEKLGGKLCSVISPKSDISSVEVKIEAGCNVLSNSIISSGVSISKGCIVYYNAILSHDCTIGDFVELSPGATLLGGVKVASYTQIGANATILPKINIGSNVIIGAGAVVTKDIPDNCIAYGVPAKIKNRK